MDIKLKDLMSKTELSESITDMNLEKLVGKSVSYTLIKNDGTIQIGFKGAGMIEFTNNKDTTLKLR